MTDVELWEKLQAGDNAAFLLLYRKYYHPLLFIGLKEIKDSDLVKDCIQQLFLHIWEKRQTLAVARDVRSYLIISFLRKLTSDWKKSSKYEYLEVVWHSDEAIPSPTPEELLISKQSRTATHSILMQHINALPARQRELIMLRFYEGLSYDEIAERTQLTHRTVYNKIHEALKKLKSGIRKNEHDYTKVMPILISWIALSQF